MNATDRAIGQRDPRWRLPIWGVATALLLLPAAASMFTSEVEWTAFDFAAMGLLLAALAGTLDFITTRRWSSQKRALGVVVAILAFLLTWAVLATS